MRLPLKTRLLLVVGFGLGLSRAGALDIEFDYSNDVATDNFFTLNPTAKSALEAAADTIRSWVQTSLAAITSDVIFGTNGETTANFNWSYTYTLPSTGGTRTIQSTVLPADRVTLFAGVRELVGSETAQGGPGGMGLGLSGVGYGVEWAGAVADGAQQSQEVFDRGDGPVIGRVQGTAFLDGYPASYVVDCGPSVGSLWFDVDTNDDGLTDTPGQLADFWHFDHTSPVAANHMDFYSVAMHEILHTLGFGSARSWTALRSGTSWFGQYLMAENGGSSQGLLDPDGKHLSNSLMSPRLSDGVMQEPLMAALFDMGERREMTRMDLAALRDIGWTVPEPATLASLLAATTLFLRRRRSNELF